jgi:hypothetical protein
MSTATPSIPAFEMPPVAVKKSLMAVSFALRFAFVGLSLSFAGVIALFTGGMDPLNAAVLAVCGGGVAYASIQYVRRWSDAESALEQATAATAAHTSMHQPVFAGSSKLQRLG